MTKNSGGWRSGVILGIAQVYFTLSSKFVDVLAHGAKLNVAGIICKIFLRRRMITRNDAMIKNGKVYRNRKDIIT